MNFLNRLFAKPVVVEATLANKKHVPPTIQRIMTMINVGKTLVPHPISVEVPEEYHLQFEIEGSKQVFVCNKNVFTTSTLGSLYKVSYKRTWLTNKIRITNIANK